MPNVDVILKSGQYEPRQLLCSESGSMIPGPAGLDDDLGSLTPPTASRTTHGRCTESSINDVVITQIGCAHMEMMETSGLLGWPVS